ncbi:uncharacterized protein LOC135828372 [Sycon ciliatum]|uniref:uncharacterized protein LOC135828372 n=1 Tax=Sycon ciliatum TaxID=27933 RepID=UPI0031F6A2EC
MASVGSGFDLPLRTLCVTAVLTLFIGYVHCQTSAGPTLSSSSCSEDLGIASGLLSSQYFTASSSYSDQYVGATYTYQPGDARAGKMRGYGGWAPVTNSLEEYLQIDYGTEVSITSMAIHGFKSMHESKGRYVTSFNIYIGTGNGVFTSVAPSFNLTSFSGNTDSSSAHKHTFSPPLKATVIRLSNFTTATSVLPGLKIGFRGCNPPPVFADLQACDTALGVSSGVVNNSLITASSVYSLSYAAYYARLYKSFGNGGFCASNGFTASDYLQVDLGQVRLVSAIASQGIEDSFLTSPYYTSRYSVRYGLVPGGVNLTELKKSGQAVTHVFSGNTDKNTVVKQYFAAPIRARFIRMFDFSPRSTHSDPCMRIEIYGCMAPKLTTPTPSPSTAASTATEPGADITTVTKTMTGTVPPMGTDATKATAPAVHQVSVATDAQVGTDSGGNPLTSASSTVSTSTEEGTEDSSSIVALGAGIGAGVACILIIMFVVLFIKYGRRGRKDIPDGGRGSSKDGLSTSDSSKANLMHYSSSTETHMEPSARSSLPTGRVSESVIYHAPRETGPETRKSAVSVLYKQPVQSEAVRYTDIKETGPSATVANGDNQYARLSADMPVIPSAVRTLENSTGGYNDSDGFDQLPAYSSLHIYANPADRQQQTSCAQTAALDTATTAATTTATHNGTAVHGNSGRNSLATAGESMNPAYTVHDIDQKTDGSATADGHYDSTNHAPLQPAVASNAIGGDSPQGRYSHLRHSVNSSTKAGGDKEPANPQDVYSHLHEQPKESTNQYDSPKGAANAYASPKPTSAACADNGEGTYNTLQRADGAYDNLELKKDNVYSTLQQQSSADDTAVTTSP